MIARGIGRRVKNGMMEDCSQLDCLVHWFPYADHLIVLGADGYITGSGTFQELQSTNSYIASLEVVPIQAIPTQPAPEKARVFECHEAGGEKRRFDDLTSVSSASVVDINDNARCKADTGNLLSYLRTFRPVSTILFFSLATLQIASRTVQREYYFAEVLRLHALIASSVLTKYFAALWLKFWVEANTVDPDTNIALWASIYTLYGIATLAFFGLEVWCAPGKDGTVVAMPLPIAFVIASECKEPSFADLYLHIYTLRPLIRKPSYQPPYVRLKHLK